MNRSDEVEASLVRNHNEYKALSSAIRDIFNELILITSEDKQYLLFELEEKKNEQSSLIMDSLYKQGVLDGITLSHRSGGIFGTRNPREDSLYD
jgi:hypothetical protein